MKDHIHLWQSAGWTTWPKWHEFAGCRCGALTYDPSIIATVKRWIAADRRAERLAGHR